MNKIKLDTIEEAIEDFRKGEFVIVVDDEDRENEGDLIIAAELITPEKVNFMLKHARGVLCAPITISRCKELDLPHQVSNNTSVLGTPLPLQSINWKVVAQEFRLSIVLLPFVLLPILLLHQKHLDVLDTLIRCMHKIKEYYVVPDILKHVLIWQNLPDYIQQVL